MTAGGREVATAGSARRRAAPCAGIAR